MKQLHFLSPTAGVPIASIGFMPPIGDYVNVPNQELTLSTTSTSFPYQLIDDDSIEGTETFQLTLAANPAEGPITISPGGAIATISILEDDGKQLSVAYT